MAASTILWLHRSRHETARITHRSLAANENKQHFVWVSIRPNPVACLSTSMAQAFQVSISMLGAPSASVMHEFGHL